MYSATAWAESFPPHVLKIFNEATPEAFAPKELKEPYEKIYIICSGGTVAAILD